MKKNVEIFKDKGKVCIVQTRPDNPPRTDRYLTVRTGISWPKANSPGYYCILGLADQRTLTEKKPLVLLAEGKNDLLEKFFEKLIVNANRLYSERVFANLEKNKGFEKSLYKFIRNRKTGSIRPWDSDEFEDFDHGISLINQYKQHRALRIPNSILLRQLQSATPDDVNKFEEQFYAVAALCRVLGSFEAYPWRRSEGENSGFTGFANIYDRAKNDGESSAYMEIYGD